MPGFEADAFEQPAHAVALLLPARDAVDGERLADDRAGGHSRVERGVGVLENDLHVPPLPPQFVRREFEKVPAPERDLPAGRLDQAQDATAGGGLAAAAFADQAEGVLAAQGERDSVHGLDPALHAAEEALADGEVLFQALDSEKRAVGVILRRSRFILHSASARRLNYGSQRQSILREILTRTAQYTKRQRSHFITQHADQWPGRFSSSGGCSPGQMSMAIGQRGWKRQPVGQFAGLGTWPWMASRRSFRSALSRGMNLKSARVYGCRGFSKRSSVEEYSAGVAGVHDEDAPGHAGHDAEVVRR